MSFHLPVISARPGSVVSGSSRRSCGCAACRAACRASGATASVRPMSIGRATEWLPTLGVSWQVVQVPADRGHAEVVVQAAHAGDVDPGRVEERRAAGDRGLARVGRAGPGVEERHRAGVEPAGLDVGAEHVVDRHVERLRRQVRRAALAPLRSARPAARSMFWAVTRFSSNWAIDRPHVVGAGPGPGHAPSVASLPWCVRSSNRPARSARATRRRGSGTSRGGERLAAVPHHGRQEAEVGRRQRPAEQRQLGGTGEAVRVVDGDQVELGAAGIGRPIRITPLLSSMLYGRLPRRRETSAAGEFEPSLVRKIGSRPPVAGTAPDLGAGDRPARARDVARGARPAVGARGSGRTGWSGPGARRRAYRSGGRRRRSRCRWRPAGRGGSGEARAVTIARAAAMAGDRLGVNTRSSSLNRAAVRDTMKAIAPR